MQRTTLRGRHYSSDPAALTGSQILTAALDGVVRFGVYFEVNLDIAVISASTDLKGDDQYGEVSSGVVTLHGEDTQANCDFIDWGEIE